jgi:hypothetical protein
MLLSCPLHQALALAKHAMCLLFEQGCPVRLPCLCVPAGAATCIVLLERGYSVL